jgi:hypothetical protein
VLTPLLITMAMRTTTALPSHPLPVMPTTQGLGQSLLPSTPGAHDGAAATPITGDGAKDILCLPHLFIATPTHQAANVHCPVCQDVALLQDRRVWVHPTGHLRCGHTSSTNRGSDSALALLPSALACHYCNCCHPGGQGAQAMLPPWQACAGR